MSMTLIEHIEVGSGGAASIIFSAISDSFNDLLVVCSLKQNTRNAPNGGFAYTIAFNGSSSNHSGRMLRGSGSATLSQTASNIYVVGGASDEEFGSSSIYISNYRSAVAKSVSVDGVGEKNSTAAYQYIVAGLWNDTSAITSLKLEGLFGDDLIQYSSATLYGITAGSDGTTTVS